MIKPKCLAEIANAIGRQLTQGEIDGIQERIQRHLNMLARQDREGFLSMTQHERVTAAAKSAAEEVLADADRRAQNTARNIVASVRNLEEMRKLAFGKSDSKGLARLLNVADDQIKGIGREHFSMMMDAIQAAEPHFFELMENRGAVKDFLSELYGIDTGNKVAKDGAKAWQTTAETMRQRFNRGGGDIGKLSYGYIPQPHDQVRILKAGAEKWIADTLPLLDRNRYFDSMGNRLSDMELRAALSDIYDTLSTGGKNQIEPGEGGNKSALANRLADHRVLHFTNPDSYLSYMDSYGRGSVFEAMQRHVTQMSRDIGLIEQFGPNPESTFKTLNDTAIKSDGKQLKTGGLWVSNDERWNTLTNFYAMAVDPKWAQVGSATRNFMSVAKLQGNLLSSLADLPTFALTLHYNNLPIVSNLMTAFRNMVKADHDAIEFANRVGLVTDSVISDMNRWAGDNLAQGWTGKLANTTQKVSLMNRWTDALKRSFSVSYMGALGRITRGEWSALDKADMHKLEEHGIDQATWDVWKAATPENWRGSQMLTPQSIRAIQGLDIGAKDRAVTKLLGMIADESDYAVISPDLDTRSRVSSTGQRGTFNGELGRALYLFKSFPMAMVSRQLERIHEMPNGMEKLGYAASLIGGLTLFGALSIQAKDLVAGKDPRDMTGRGGTDKGMLAKFWLGAFAQGGGGGVFSDLLYTGMGGNSRGGQPNWTNLFGPVLGTAFDISNATIGEIGKAATGQKTNFGAEATRVIRGNTPFVNLWYARAALDHAVFHDLQDRLSPGYLSRMQSSAAQQYNQQYWWQPQRGNVFQGTMKGPQREPNLKSAIGQR